MASSRKPPRNSGAVGEALAAALGRAGARGSAVCVALSGGVDSVVLLHALAVLGPSQSLKLSALHVNHGLSPNAYAWERYCRALCRRLHVPLTVRRVKVAARRKAGLESAAREARYAALARARVEFVLLAHQRDDQAETVLMNLLRGAGLRGAAAMPESGPLPTAADGAPRALRPMLSVSRDAIVAYATTNGLEWIEDESNADEGLARNWVRRRVGPLLASRYPRWRESLARAAAHFAEAGQLLSGDVPDRLSVPALRAAAGAKAKLMLRDFLRSGGARAPDARRLDEMLRQVLGAPADARLDLRHDGMVLRRFRDELALLPGGGVQGEVVLHACKGSGIDAAKLKAQPVSVRARQGGERMRLAANRPSRSLKNLFQEAGIPPWDRDRIPLLYCGEELVWVPGLGIAAGFHAARGRPGVLPEWKRFAQELLRKSLRD